MNTVSPKCVPARTARWKFEKANWACFTEATQLASSSLDELSVDQVTELLSECILSAASLAIPMTSSSFPGDPSHGGTRIVLNRGKSKTGLGVFFDVTPHRGTS